ncbi:glycosyl hydrolase [Flavobacteriaceae bacterium]|nr:glycosyl hydrolase [Flavobacteriaceae bacterium]
MKLVHSFLLLCTAITLTAQSNDTQNSIVKNIPFENIGPKVMSGRIVALEVNPADPTEFYAAFASGGIWHTKDNGISFTSITDNAPTQNIGEIAMHWPSKTLWVGTGENNASRSSYAGIGMLKTTDNGISWEVKGLEDSHHIGKILINPNNPEEVVVGVTGHLYTPNAERGIYRSEDGGDSWEQVLFVNETSGIIDMSIVPNDFNIQYAAAWQKDRKAWNFSGNGSSSGIYKSTDAGKTWALISTDESGFPTGTGVGRIGLAVYDENTVYAIHDSQFRRPDDAPKKANGLTKNDFKSMSKEAFLALQDKSLNAFLKENNFQEKYRAANLKNSVRNGLVMPKDLAIYLEDANALLFDTPVIGAEVFKSTDGGTTWTKTHTGYIDDLYYSYGYYFGHIHVAPKNGDKIYIYGVPLLTSDDGGASFSSIGKSNVHSDHHALWINPNKPGHLINGNDGGVNITYDDGAHWMKNNSTAVGQFYAINIDHEKPYNVYGGLQDNGVWKGAHNARNDERWQATGHNPWTSIMGGDGMQVQIDNRNSNIVYTGYQFGNYFRLNLETKKRTYIQPKHELGEAPYRFNWQTPILLSSHNQDILYLGGNKLHRSLNQGDDWATISDDLTQGGKKGNVAFGTLTTIAESPAQFGFLYTGSDDGYIHRSENGGGSWDRISDDLPQDLWVSRVIASEHQKERVYVTLNGYRNDDFAAYVYVSEDRGISWKSINKNLPNSPVNVIREDPNNDQILYLGNDQGVYVSFDQGQKWQPFNKGLTTAAVHDLVVQPEANHLLVGTHGRSIYKADLAPFQKLNNAFLKQELALLDPEKVKHSKRWGSSYSSWRKVFEPETTFTAFAKTSGAYEMQIKDVKGTVLFSQKGTLDVGFNFVIYALEKDANGIKNYNKKNKKSPSKSAKNGTHYLEKGTYSVEFTKGTIKRKKELHIQ